MAAWDPVIRALEAQKPEWEPGTEHVYHSATFGYLVGEVVRRISGKSLGTFFADEVAGPLGLHAWIGLPEEQEPNVARIDTDPLDLELLIAGMIETTGLDADTVTRWFQAVWGEGSVQARAGSLGGAFDDGVELQDARAYRAAEIPAGNMLDERAIVGPHVRRHRQRRRRRTTAEPGHCRAGDRGPDRQDPDARTARGPGTPGRPLLLHVARVLACLPAVADGRDRTRSATRAPVARSASETPMPRSASAT